MTKHKVSFHVVPHYSFLVTLEITNLEKKCKISSILLLGLAIYDFFQMCCKRLETSMSLSSLENYKGSKLDLSARLHLTKSPVKSGEPESYKVEYQIKWSKSKVPTQNGQKSGQMVKKWSCGQKWSNGQKVLKKCSICLKSDQIVKKVVM